ncbi:MAG TPA: hypothetical protein VOA64_05375 [Candidatus Dormibacteraeota bacterium]|nr:hypothetical protein [Candidatus Dormibacteraeota bacterium]
MRQKPDLALAIRAILKTAKGDWLTATNVRDRLSDTGFDFSSYLANPDLSIYEILRRMKEAEASWVDGGFTVYRWKESNDEGDAEEHEVKQWPRH